jgi:hypothetical protein
MTESQITLHQRGQTQWVLWNYQRDHPGVGSIVGDGPRRALAYLSGLASPSAWRVIRRCVPTVPAWVEELCLAIRQVKKTALPDLAPLATEDDPQPFLPLWTDARERLYGVRCFPRSGRASDYELRRVDKGQVAKPPQGRFERMQAYSPNPGFLVGRLIEIQLLRALSDTLTPEELIESVRHLDQLYRDRWDRALAQGYREGVV